MQLLAIILFMSTLQNGLNDCIDDISLQPYRVLLPILIVSQWFFTIITVLFVGKVREQVKSIGKLRKRVTYFRSSDQLKKIKLLFRIRIDEGGDEEASEVLYLGSDVTSDNVILIPTENIKFYYGSTQINPGATIDSNTYSADASEFRIEIVPVSGQSGKAEIKFKILGDGDSSLDIKFDVTVNAASALHNGWVSLKALGPKVNKYGQAKDESAICPYSETKCDGGSPCLGSGSRWNKNGRCAYAIYYDESNKNVITNKWQ